MRLIENVARPLLIRFTICCATATASLLAPDAEAMKPATDSLAPFRSKLPTASLAPAAATVASP